MNDIRFVRAARVRMDLSATLNSAWLRDRLLDDPTLLGLGALCLADEGRTQDGRLELLLRDPTRGTRFTVIVRTGPAEEIDLVRAIETWTIERGRYPEHDHFAVVAAEELPPRFLSAANTLGETFPLSVLQLSALQIGEQTSLYADRVVDRLPKSTGVDQGLANGNGNGNGHAKLLVRIDDARDVEPAIPFADAPIEVEDTSHESRRSTPKAPTTVAAIDQSPGLPWTQSENVSTSADVAAPVRSAEPKPKSDIPAPAVTSAVSVPVLPEWLTSSEESSPSREALASGRIFGAACVISLLLCLTMLFGWLRSHSARDAYTFADTAGRNHVLYSDHGRVEWIVSASPAGTQDGRYVKIPYWLPVCIAALLPSAWIIRRWTRCC